MKIERTKVFRVLKRLSSREQQQVRLFLASPFFNKRSDIQALFEYLILPRSIAIVPNDLFKALYPTRVFRAQRLRTLFSQLFRLLEHYLVYQEHFKEEKISTHKRLAVHAYQAQQLPKLAHQSLHAYQIALAESQIQNADYYTEYFNWHTENHSFSSLDEPSQKQAFEPMLESLDTAYISYKLQYACYALSNQFTYGHQYEIHLLPEIIAFVKAKQWHRVPAIGVYFYIYRAFTAPNAQAAFEQLKQLLPDATAHFPPKELRDIYLMLINHCIRGINKGDLYYQHEILDLYKEGLRSDSLLENGKLSRFTYSNIVRIAAKAGDLEWAETFIQDYKECLEKPFQENTFSLNAAILAYTRKNYEQALGYLQHFNYRNVVLALSAKTLLLKIYYEQGEWNMLDSHLQAMSNYIRRQKKEIYHSAHYLNIINYTRRLHQLNPYDKAERMKLRKRIQKEENLIGKEWLLERLSLVSNKD